MELRTTREMRRNAQLDKVMLKKTDAPAKAQASQPKEPADKFSLSQQALAYVDEQNRKLWDWNQAWEERRQSRMDEILGSSQSKSKELELLEKAMDVMNKCLKIAASIMKGNRVPPEDLEYLMKNDPDGYRMALALRRENPDPKDEKSVLDDEDKNGGAEESGGEAEAPQVSAPEASAGGGEASSGGGEASSPAE